MGAFEIFALCLHLPGSRDFLLFEIGACCLAVIPFISGWIILFYQIAHFVSRPGIGVVPLHYRHHPRYQVENPACFCGDVSFAHWVGRVQPEGLSCHDG